MSRYIIEFSKTGTICFTSHLDLLRIFKRVCKRTGVPMAYSQGFNPHPKMGFAQPLSLGYWGMGEFFECEITEDWTEEQLIQKLAGGMPEGIELKRCLNADHLKKTLSSHTVAAEYVIAVPVRMETVIDRREPRADVQEPDGEVRGCEPPQPGDAACAPDPNADLSDPRGLWHSYMEQEEILVWKRQKKKKEPKLVDIRPMIREIAFTPMSEDEAEGNETKGSGQITTLYVDTVIDCGSESNLSPELIISSVCRRFGIGTDRSEVSVMRKRLLFDQPLDELLR